MIIDDIEVTVFSSWDGFPIKNKLPENLNKRLKTKTQWLELKFVVLDDAVGYDMHPNSMNKKLCTYYLDTQVTKISPDVECCATCKLRSGYYCIVMADYICLSKRCSEWCN